MKMLELKLLATTLTLSWYGRETLVLSIIPSNTNTVTRSCLNSACCQRSIQAFGSLSSPSSSSITPHRQLLAPHKAALVNDLPSSSRRGGGRHRRQGRESIIINSNGTNNDTKSWHQRIFFRIRWRRGGQSNSVSVSSSSSSEYSSSSSSSSLTNLQMIRGDTNTAEYEIGTKTGSFIVSHQDTNRKNDSDFITKNFNTLNPESVFPINVSPKLNNDKEKKTASSLSLISSNSITVDTTADTKTGQDIIGIDRNSESRLTIDSEYFDVKLRPAAAVSANNEAEEGLNVSRRRGLICRFLERILTERIGQRWSVELPEDLMIDVRPSLGKYNGVGRLFRGHFRADATLSTGRIVFDPIRFSSLQIELEQVTLNFLGFFQSNDEKSTIQKKQCPKNTKHHWQQKKQNARYPKQFDLHIKDLTMSRQDLHFSPCVRNGLRRLLIKILKNRGVQTSSIKITSIDILPNGKVSCKGDAKTNFGSALINFEVRSGISSSTRGHVLTFPGLEISLNRDIGLFVPVLPTLDLDVGHNTTFKRIIIDGKQKLIKIGAKVTITPDRTVRLMRNYVQTSDAFSAKFSYDIGVWLTKLGNFSK